MIFEVRQQKIGKALEEIREHKMSIGKAAEVCGISIWEILELLKEKNIEWTGYNEEDLQKDLNLINRK